MEKDLSANTAESQERKEAKAGENELNFADASEPFILKTEKTKSTEAVTTLENETELSVEENIKAEKVENVNVALKEMNEDEVLVDASGEILAAGETTFMTVGGADYVSYVAPTIDTIDNSEIAIPVNGAAQSGKYIETIEQGGQYYAHVIIGGFEGYMHLEDIQIIPSSLEVPQTYFSNINGDWTKFVPVDPLTSTEYQSYTVDVAPQWAAAGAKYYTADDETFYTEPFGEVRNATSYASNSTYFQNLPFRSSSDYSGSNFKSYLTSIGRTNSAYYNATNAFTDAQKYYGINALYLFAWANHEGAFGTSHYSYQCNNFFGMGANDKNPDNACIEYGWDTPRDGILAEADIVTSGYADVNDWRFYGTEPGDKTHGINVKYASDPNWGNAMAGQMYQADKYLGSKEVNRYRIYAIHTSEQVYNDSGLTSKVKQQGAFTPGDPDGLGYRTVTDFKMVRNDYDDDKNVVKYADPRVVVTNETSKSFEYQLNTPVNVGESGYVQFWLGKRGTYPNFGPTYGGKGQLYENYVTKGYSNSNNIYGTNWSKQQKWYPKKNSYGTQTYKVINDVAVVSPGSSIPDDVKPDLKTSVRKVSFASNDKVNIEGVGYLRGVNTASYNDVNSFIEFVNADTNKIASTQEVWQKSNPSVMNTYETDGRQYDAGYFVTPNNAGLDLSKLSNGTYKIYLKSTSTKNSKFTDREWLTSSAIGDKVYYRQGKKAYTIYSKDNKLMLKVSNSLYDYEYNSDNSLKRAYLRDGDGNPLYIYEYYSGAYVGKNPGNKIKYIFTINDGKIVNSKKYTYDTKQKKRVAIASYEYYPNTVYGKNHGSHIKFKFSYPKGYLTAASRRQDNTQKALTYYEYYPNTVYGKNHGSHIKYAFDVDAKTQYLVGANRRINGGGIDRYYEYYPKTKYGNHGSHIKYTFYINGKYLTTSYKYADKTGKKLVKYYYQSGTIYGKNHGSRITKRIYY